VSLYEIFDQDFKKALKARDEVWTSVLRMLKTVIKNKEVELRRKLDEPELVALVKSQAKQRGDSIFHFEKGGRDDLVRREQAELAILEGYLPRQLGQEELERAAAEVIGELGASSAKDTGRVMKEFMGRHGGQADGKAASEVIRRMLSGH